MVYAVIHAENADVLATYSAWEDAVEAITGYVSRNPGSEDEIGIRPYAKGRPAGKFESASTVLGDRVPQQHIAPLGGERSGAYAS
jgi:hypothetical protein